LLLLLARLASLAVQEKSRKGGNRFTNKACKS
jgi:hypothetical protein